jgi:predicted ATP-grasp superfamily ATP-dependent carboligase
MEADILLIGASVRAAAQSARRAGLRPWCADLFADADLRAIAPAVALPGREYPHGFLPLLRWAPAGPVLYTGGLENHPDLIDALALERPLWGNPGPVLRRVRDPLRLQSVLTAAGITMPATLEAPTGLPTDGTWLLKPRRGAGGAGIAPWCGQEPAPGRDYCWQRRVSGQPRSALFLGDGQRSWCLGWAEQLVGTPWLHAGPFSFCGAVGPLPWDRHRSALERLGDLLVQSFGLRGVFGVDMMVESEVFWVLEVNPRYPASAELYEHAFGISLIAAQQRLFQGGTLAEVQANLPEAPQTGCKLILFAPSAFSFDPARLPGIRGVELADIPMPGTAVAKGQPILTILATTLAAGRSAAERVYRALEWTAGS